MAASVFLEWTSKHWHIRTKFKRLKLTKSDTKNHQETDIVVEENGTDRPIL